MKLPSAWGLKPQEVSISDDVFVKMEDAGSVKLNARHRARCRKILMRYVRTYRSSLAAPEPDERRVLDKLLEALDAMKEALEEPVGWRFKAEIFMNSNIEWFAELERIVERAKEMDTELSQSGKKPRAFDVAFLLPLAEDVWDQAGGDPADSKNFTAFAWVMVQRCLIPLRLGPPSRDALKKAWSRHLDGHDV